MAKSKKSNVKRYLISSLVTFLTGFALVLVAQIDSLSLESFKDGALAGVLFSALRAGIKGVLEYFLDETGDN
jgi:hypothetical protein